MHFDLVWHFIFVGDMAAIFFAAWKDCHGDELVEIGATFICLGLGSVKSLLHVVK